MVGLRCLRGPERKWVELRGALVEARGGAPALPRDGGVLSPSSPFPPLFPVLSPQRTALPIMRRATLPGRNPAPASSSATVAPTPGSVQGSPLPRQPLSWLSVALDPVRVVAQRRDDHRPDRRASSSVGAAVPAARDLRRIIPGTLRRVFSLAVRLRGGGLSWVWRRWSWRCTGAAGGVGACHRGTISPRAEHQSIRCTGNAVPCAGPVGRVGGCCHRAFLARATHPGHPPTRSCAAPSGGGAMDGFRWER